MRIGTVVLLALVVPGDLCRPFTVSAADVSAAKAAEAPKRETPRAANPDPATQSYAQRKLEGWTILVNERLLADKELSGQVLRLLQDDLYGITRVVPADAVGKLRKVPIWVELDHPQHPCACYHPSADWLREHGMDVKKARAVEIANARNYLSWTRAQPTMILHELAHAYHHQVLGFDNEEIKACYDAAVAGKSYESVLHFSGVKKRHYALKNPQEYFAEATEAYFGTNDFYPFVRPELKVHDPRMYDLLGKLWGDRPASAGTKP
jgi:hypothetical protein